MSIASELTNLEGNIEDSYDAVNDMGGIIPAQRNMDNLDQAIRTIPQNQGTTYTAGNGINIDANNEISIDTTVVAEVTDLPSDMAGATSSVAGTHGLVPAPTTADVDKYLKGDGTWATVQSGAEVKKFYIDNDYIFRDGTVNQEILDAPGGDAVSDATLFAAMKDGLVMIIANSDGMDYESAIATNAWMDSGVLKFTIYGSSSVDSSIDVMQVVSTGGGYYDFDGYDIVPKNGTLTIQHNGTNVQTFSANSSTNKTANVETIWADPITSTAALTPPIQTNMLADGAVTSAKIGWSTMEHWSITLSGNKTISQTTAYNYVDVPDASVTFTATVGGVYLVLLNASVMCAGGSTDCYAKALLNGGNLAVGVGQNPAANKFTSVSSAQVFTATQASNTIKMQLGGGIANANYTILGSVQSSVQIMRIA